MLKTREILRLNTGRIMPKSDNPKLWQNNHQSSEKAGNAGITWPIDWLING